jgi:ATP-dependent DNA ligase
MGRLPLIARRDGNRVRLYTRRGYDWSGKYPWIVDMLLSLSVRSTTVDGEAVRCGKDGKSECDKLHSGAHNDEVFLYAFDLLELNSEEYRQHPLAQRKAKLEKILVAIGAVRFIRKAMRSPSLSAILEPNIADENQLETDEDCRSAADCASERRDVGEHRPSR